MALTKPVLQKIVAFDKKDAILFNFASVGGSQVIRNELRITNNQTNQVAYQQIIETFKLEHVLPSHSLINGLYYRAEIRTYDIGSDVSAWSAPIQFYCHTTPIVKVINIPMNNIIQNSSYMFNGTYMQIEGERLNSYMFILYDEYGKPISSSTNLYTTTAPPNSFSYIFSGFDDNKNYSISIDGVTVNGTKVTSGKIGFSIKYIQPNAFTVLELQNHYCDGTIDLATNIVDIEGKPNPKPPMYIGDGKVDLRGKGHYIIWDEGYNIGSDFTLRIKLEDINENTIICRIEEKDILNKLEIGYWEMKQGIVFIDLNVYQGNVNYYAYSNEIPKPLDTSNLFVWVRKINNIYEVKLGDTSA